MWSAAIPVLASFALSPLLRIDIAGSKSSTGKSKSVRLFSTLPLVSAFCSSKGGSLKFPLEIESSLRDWVSVLSRFELSESFSVELTVPWFCPDTIFSSISMQLSCLVSTIHLPILCLQTVPLPVVVNVWERPFSKPTFLSQQFSWLKDLLWLEVSKVWSLSLITFGNESTDSLSFASLELSGNSILLPLLGRAIFSHSSPIPTFCNLSFTDKSDAMFVRACSILPSKDVLSIPAAMSSTSSSVHRGISWHSVSFNLDSHVWLHCFSLLGWLSSFGAHGVTPSLMSLFILEISEEALSFIWSFFAFPSAPGTYSAWSGLLVLLQR